MIFRVLVFIFLSGVTAISQAGSWRRLDSKTIAFQGGIEIDELQRFKEIYKSTDEYIVLNSSGGRMDAALDIGQILVQNKKLTAVVDGMCASSCANYLFLAAPKKIIRNGFVGFHGNWKAMMDKDEAQKHLAALPAEQQAKLREFHESHIVAETAFLKITGASQALFDRTQKENDEGLYDVYLPGPKEFERYGIHNVTGMQNLNLVGSNKVLFENGPDVNNAEALKDLFRQEFYSASDKRRGEIRFILKALNQQFPNGKSSGVNSNSVGAR